MDEMKLKIKANSILHASEECLSITTSINDRVVHELYNFKEKTMRDALIKLGWEPPKEKLK